MNKSRLIKSATILVPVLTLGVIAGSVSAAETTKTNSATDRRVRVELSDEQKTALDQIQELRKAGKTDEAKTLAESVGLPNGEGMKNFREHGGKFRMKMDDGKRENHEAVRTAIQNNDYNAFKTASADLPFGTDIDEAKFAKLVEAHKLMEQARALLDEAGIKGPFMHGMHQGAAPVETP